MTRCMSTLVRNTSQDRQATHSAPLKSGTHLMARPGRLGDNDSEQEAEADSGDAASVTISLSLASNSLGRRLAANHHSIANSDRTVDLIVSRLCGISRSRVAQLRSELAAPPPSPSPDYAEVECPEFGACEQDAAGSGCAARSKSLRAVSVSPSPSRNHDSSSSSPTASPRLPVGRSVSESGRRSPSPPLSAVRELALLNKWRHVARVIASGSKRPRSGSTLLGDSSGSECSSAPPSPTTPLSFAQLACDLSPLADSLLTGGPDAVQQLALNPNFQLVTPAPNEILIRAPGGYATRIKVNYESSFVQLSGHEGCFVPAGPGTVWKKRSEATGDRELKAYQRLMRDDMCDMVPEFYGEVHYQGEDYIEIEDLLFSFDRSSLSVMDLKMGSRTFLESEVCNTKARADLYEKMVRLDATAPTEEEHSLRAVTKLRYMQFREASSSSSTLGFRIEGYSVDGGQPTKDVKLLRDRRAVSETIESFLTSATPLQRQTFVSRLRVLRAKFERSKFFHHHEVIGSSLLLVRDGTGAAGVWMIDFARTYPLPDGLSVTHRAPWLLGNHEDGFLFGLDNVIEIMEELAGPAS